MKMPKTDANKFSLPGEFIVDKGADGLPTVYPKEESSNHSNAMVVVYDCGKAIEWKWETFDQVRARLDNEWKIAATQKQYDVISPQLKSKISQIKNKMAND
jgi:hypothetical protein